eukprot:3528475-Pyramimonas_sp.AAC.1
MSRITADSHWPWSAPGLGISLNMSCTLCAAAPSTEPSPGSAAGGALASSSMRSLRSSALAMS